MYKKNTTMKIKILLGALACSALLASCSDQMNYREDTGGKYNKEDIEKIFDRVTGFVTNVYASVDCGFDEYGAAFESSATDESDYSVAGNSIETFFNGSWSPSKSMNTMWTQMYTGISAANLYLDQFSEGLTFPEHELDDNYSKEIFQYKNRFPYEVRFLRAYFYFNLVRQYGAVPFYTKDIQPEEVNNLERTPAKDIFKFIDEECAAIADKLPSQWSEDNGVGVANENLRATRLAVLALRARAALYAASPLFNTENDASLWRTAALRNKEVIDACLKEGFKLPADYNSIWAADNTTIAPGHEMIFVRSTMYSAGNYGRRLEQRNFPVGITGAGAGGNCPTQSLVEAYDVAADGSELDWNDPNEAMKSIDKLDPRFAKTVARNGDVWPFYNAARLETYENGASGLPAIGATTTGYYLKKLLDNKKVIDLRPGKNTTAVHSWVVFRLGEFYLNYAEAVFRMTGGADVAPNGDGFTSGYLKTAREAVNETRTRAGVAGLPTNLTSDQFWHKYERERMVELAFEGHRFWDVRRWKEGDKFSGKNIYVMHITKNNDGTFNYERQTLADTRIDWNDKMYFFPIPVDEMLKHEQYGVKWNQNTGWE